MKELSLEEKSKAYDEALERARKLEENSNGMILKKWLWSIFPELKESEDEKIRKLLIRLFTSNANEKFDDVSTEEIIVWLEKQGNVDKVSYEIAEKEKYDFVSGQFIECRKSFNEFKEDNSYWFEYVGNDTYIGRSDNILNKKFHITPRQLYRLFTQQHCPKENNVNEETNAPTAYGKYVDECLNEAAKHFFSEGEDKYTVADLFYAGVRCGQSWFKKQGKQKQDVSIQINPSEYINDMGGNGCCLKNTAQVSVWSEEDEEIKKDILNWFKGKQANPSIGFSPIKMEQWIAWLEKQKFIDVQSLRSGLLRDIAMSLVNFLDENTLGMDMSSMECEDIENAIVNEDWDKVYRYMKKKLKNYAYNPYKFTIESILDMCKCYSESGDLLDFFNNVKVKCKDAIEYDKTWLEKQGEPNPYSGVSFKYNDHTWGMCARDGGVEILIDSNLKAFVSLDKSFIYPIHPQPIIVPQPAREADEEKVNDQNCVNLTDKVEPKFHKGDLVVDNRDYVWKIEEILNQSYMLKGIEGGGSLPTIEWVDKNFRLWTIQDAKDGDVLAISWWKGNNFWEKIIIFKKYHNKGVKGVYNMPCVEGYGNTFKDGKLVLNEEVPYYSKTWTVNLHPASKEQRDTLMKAMADAGWEFDFEKKELKKIKSNTILSEEDESWFKEIELMCLNFSNDTDYKEEFFTWLKSIKQKIGWKPSEEQMDALETAVSSLQSTALETLYQKLKRL